MASSSMGSLVVNLEANIARFTSDMSKASKQTEDALNKISGAVNLAKGALAALGVGASISGFAMLIKGSIDAADHLRDMSQKTGIAVATLNGLAFAAGQAGGNLESMVAAAGKLNKSIVEAAGGNKDVGEAFSKLGISVRDATGHLKTADVVMTEVADKFGKYADGPEKTAIALRLFGKAGADMIPILNDGGDAMRDNIAYAKQYSGVTADLAAASDNFNDTMGKLAIQQKSFGNAMAGAVLPILQKVADEMLGASEKSNKFAFAADAVRTVLETFVVVGSEVAYVFKETGNEIGGIAAQLAALAHADFKGFNVISEAMRADAEKARKEHDAFIASVLDRTPKPVEAQTDESGNPKPRAPTIRAAGDDPTKNILEGQIKAFEAAYAKERDIASFHDQFMQELRNQDLVDAQTYAQYKIASINQARDAAVKAYDSEIAALESARAKEKKETERAAIDNQISEKKALRTKAQADAVAKLGMETLAMGAAQSDLNKQMKEWNIQQDLAMKDMEFTNDLYGKSALEVAKLTAAHRAELEIEEKIRQAKEKGVITEASIAQYRKDAADHAARIGSAATQGAVNQIRLDQRTPEEVENDSHNNILVALEAFKAQELAHEMEGNRRIEAENQRHERAKFDMKAATEQSILSMMSSSSDQLYNLLKQAGLQQSALGKAAFLASKALAVAQIILSTNVAAASALAPPPLGLGPVAGLALSGVIKAMGYANAGIVAGLAIAEASAENGFDIPAGHNPVTQLHEKEMVLPKAQAEVIRGLAANGGKAGGGTTINHSPAFYIDSRADRTQAMAEMRQVARQANADLVDRLQRAGRI